MEALIYDNEIILGHNLYPICGKKLQAISEKDYPGKKYFDEHIESLDMDYYEKNLNKNDNKKTLDAVIGIKKHLGRNRFSVSYLMLLEFRMGYKNVNNLSAKELIEKTSHTKDLLGTDKPLYDTIFFVFNNEVIYRCISVFHNMKRANRNLKNFEPISTDDFNKYINSVSRYPYEPENNVLDIRRQLNFNNCQDDINGFLNRISYWCRNAYYYKNNKYNINEYNIIINEVKDIWHEFRSKNSRLSDEDKLDAEIIEEDYPELCDCK